ncbi:DUF6037 family protein [Bacillus safensis]|uniref:DUF6037 family protein n=1 Tax=Bacillus safensis TaxID=561879 RepID=UPI000B452675|nr:DUF6037 family protein [Bacillus safensis]UDB51566.1 DUF6037 family protein [Bacillus safensis]
MAATYLLKNLFALSKSMKKQSLDYQVINGIRYKKNLEICAIFKYDYRDFTNKFYDDNDLNKEYMLGLFKRKTNEYLELPLKHRISRTFEAFEMPLMLEKKLYNKLRIFLEIDSSHEGVFQPKIFFEALNNALPTQARKENLERKVYSYSYINSKVQEREKVYFSHFLDNDKTGKKRSLENREKTQKLLPEANKLIENRNISVCFTTIVKDIDSELTEIDKKFTELF